MGGERIVNGMENKQNKKLIILIFLSVLAVFSLIWGAAAPTKSKSRSLASSGSGSVGQEESVSLSETSSLIGEGLSVQRHAQRSAYSNWGRNPFTKGAPIKTSSLEGILWDEKVPMALISGETVKKGDKIGSSTVIDIQKDRVILNDGTKDIELRSQ